MSQNVVVIQFDDVTAASAALKAIRDQHREHQIHLNDTAIIQKDADGKVHKVNELSSATEVGAVAGGSLGLLLMFMFPIAGIAVGAASGAAIGALLGKGVDGKWVKEVTESLKPGTSALFLVFDQLTPSAMRVLEPYPGHLLQTTLPDDIEHQLRQVLHDTSSTSSASSIFPN
ncbi:MAG: DUF1269 domain-containing protein [Chloroflexi bacterium]|nr:DUF1269 domain-containing protein [Chloroflexota bacterium]MBV9595990.1 DUF1269 domain-containing protein [Chloroflexota bacterium]